MVETIGLRELNQNPSRAVARVRAGESLLVTDRGRPVLRMVPEVESPGVLSRMVADGTATARIWAWTYAASQKVRNIERDHRATLQVEAGEQYQELRGVMFECEVAIHRDLAVVQALGQEIFRRYAAPRGGPPEPSRRQRRHPPGASR